MKLANIFAFVTTMTTKYKARRVTRVVDAYLDCVDAQIRAGVPLGLDLYRSASKAIVRKTYEDPTHLVRLVEAVQGAVGHYGPELVELFTEFKEKAARAAERSDIRDTEDEFAEAMKSLKEEVWP